MVPDFEMIGQPNPCLAFDGTNVTDRIEQSDLSKAHCLEGAYAVVARASSGSLSVARDPLGLGKLFWAANGDRYLLAARPSLLIGRGVSWADCWSWRADCIVTYRPDRPTTVNTAATSAATTEADVPDERLAAPIRDQAAGFIAGVLALRPGPAVVCLSGGMDSTSVAAMVRDERRDVLAVTFDLDRPGGARSDDFLAASEAAHRLGIPLLPALYRADEVLDLLDLVLTHGIDWRDFNVHAGLVNAALARRICRHLGEQAPGATIFTGDLVNEFLADYAPETHQGTTYYPLPRLPPAALRSALVRGLSSAHREIGVFDAFGLTVAQPYAAARNHFLRLPARLLGPDDAKPRLYQAMFGTKLPGTSYQRPKLRAQIGSTDPAVGGVLAACADAGIDQRRLKTRFAELHGTEPRALDRFMRGGQYRTGIPGAPLARTH